MSHRRLTWATLAIVVSQIIIGVTALPPSRSTSRFQPSTDAARQNAFHIFNAVHSAMRQWGSSLKHNGLSFFLVTIPEGQPFYHGTHETIRPAGFEWLAFEVEHAAQFGRSWDPGQPPPGLHRPGGNDSKPSNDSRRDVLISLDEVVEAMVLHGLSHDSQGLASVYGRTKMEGMTDQKRLSSLAPGAVKDEKSPGRGNEDDDDDRKIPRPPQLPNVPTRGYIHTYRAMRPLNLIYLDGMAAAKFPLGSLDSQDYILRGQSGRAPDDIALDEMERAKQLCAMMDDWALDDRRVDGLIRMETGFEIIYCHFEEGSGLDLVNIHGTPFSNQTSPLPMMGFEWIRAAAQRYHGMPAGRVQVDFSSMVSAFAYPVNITNPDPTRPELPRFVSVAESDRHTIFSRIREVSQERHDAAPKTVDWQGIVDMIVSRFADRLWHYVTTNSSADFLLSDIGTLINPFIDFRDPQPTSADAVSRCILHYVDPAMLQPDRFTPEDAAIHAAIETVSEHICTALFDARRILFNSAQAKDPSARDDAVAKTQDILRELVERLDWSTWRECGRCEKSDEVCFIAMFPFGGVEDHFTPRCKNSTLAMASMEYFIGPLRRERKRVD